MTAPRAWTTEEDELLRQAVSEHGEGPGVWKTIADSIPGRTNKACRKRWLHSLSPSVRKVPWTPAEDALLLKYYDMYSPPRWSFIAKHIPGRTDDACSKRYREALDPLLKREEWTTEEDNQLLQLAVQLGSRWTQVGQAMGRSGLACRNRWRLFERKQRPKRRDLDPPEPSMEAAESSHFYPSHNLPSLPSDQPFSLFSSASFNFSSSMSSPPPQCISSVSSLSNALVPSTNAGQPYESMLIAAAGSCATVDRNSTQFQSPPRDTQNISCADLRPTYEYDTYAPPSYSPSPSPETLLPLQEPNSISPEVHEDANPRPAKRPCVRHSHGREQARLSSHLPADANRTIFPYACGHPRCWLSEDSSGPVSPARFATAAELAEHRRIDHAGESQSDEKLFRCALDGCGKGWKNINGIQYHLQISKAHFQHALGRYDKSSEPQSSPATRESAFTVPNHSHNGESQVLLLHTTGVTYGAHDISALVHHSDNSQSTAVRLRGQIFHKAPITDSMGTNQSSAESDASLSNEASHKRPYKRRPPKHIPCPHEGCHKVYKQRTGLQYHLAHGHISDIAQLDVVPPTLMRKVQAPPDAVANVSA